MAWQVLALGLLLRWIVMAGPWNSEFQSEVWGGLQIWQKSMGWHTYKLLLVCHVMLSCCHLNKNTCHMFFCWPILSADFSGIAEGNSTEHGVFFFDGGRIWGPLERPGIYTMIFFGLMIFHWDLHALIHPSGGEVGPKPPNWGMDLLDEVGWIFPIVFAMKKGPLYTTQLCGDYFINHYKDPY